MIGYYYLHTNGDLISKKFRPDPSDFVKRVWSLDTTNRRDAWTICIEALAMGANKSRVNELAEHWKCNDEDAQEFIKSAVDKKGNELLRLYMDGNMWCATFADFTNIQESQCGFGETCLEALAELAKPGLTEALKQEPTNKAGER